MTSFDFLSGFNNIDPKFVQDAIDLMQTVEASDAEKEIMSMENYTIHKKRPVGKSVLVAAAIIALLCAMCVGAYAVNLFGIRDAVMGSQIVSDNSEGFPALKIGSRIVVPKDKLREWVDANTTQK